jgi:hypothetical protein
MSVAGQGYRSPTAEERAELCSRAWLAWPEVPRSALIRVAPRFEAIPFRENRRRLSSAARGTPKAPDRRAVNLRGSSV